MQKQPGSETLLFLGSSKSGYLTWSIRIELQAWQAHSAVFKLKRPYQWDRVPYGYIQAIQAVCAPECVGRVTMTEIGTPLAEAHPEGMSRCLASKHLQVIDEGEVACDPCFVMDRSS